MANAQRQADALARQLEESRAARGEQEKTKEARLAQLQGELNAAQQELEVFRQQLADRQLSADEVRAELQQSRELAETLARDLEAAQRSGQGKEARAAELERALGETQAHLQHLASQLAERKEEEARQAAALEAAREKLEVFRRHGEESEQRARRLEEKAQQAAERQAEAERLLHESLGREAGLQQARQKMQESEAEGNRRAAELARENQELREKNRRLGTELESTQQETTRLQSDLQTLQQEYEEWKAHTVTGSEQFWFPRQRTFLYHFGVVRVGGADDATEYFDVIFPAGTELPPPGELLRLEREPYHPKHNIGHLRYLLCSHLAHNMPAGETFLLAEVFFPYDTALRVTAELSPELVVLSDAWRHTLVQEIYYCNHEGTVACELVRLEDGRAFKRYFTFFTLSNEKETGEVVKKHPGEGPILE